MTQNEIIDMARQAGFGLRYEGRRQISSAPTTTEKLEAFAKLVAAKAIAKDRQEFDIDELCARQNKIGYKQGYRAGQLAEREACAKYVDGIMVGNQPLTVVMGAIGDAIRARGKTPYESKVGHMFGDKR